MKFTITTVAVAMAGLVAGQVALTNTGYGLREGSPFTLTWAGASGPVTVYLEGGPSGNLVDLATLASGVTDTSYVYTPPPALCANEQYAFKIVDGSTTNYSPQFYIGGLTPCTLSTSSSSTSSMTTGSMPPMTTGSMSPMTTGSTSLNAFSMSLSTGGAGVSASLSNYTSPASASPTTMSTGASLTRTAPKSSSTITNTNNGQRASYSLSAILLVTVAGLFCIN